MVKVCSDRALVHHTEAFLLSIDLILLHVDLDRPIKTDQEVHVEIDHCIEDKLNPTVSEMAIENSEKHGENEEGVDYLADNKANFSGHGVLFVKQAHAPH